MFQLHGIIGLNARDHNIVYAVRKQPKIKRTYKFTWARSFRNFDPLLFERDVIFENWSDVIDEPNGTLAWDNFANKLVFIIDRHAPYKKLRVSDSMPKWVTREYLSACDERDALHRRYSKNKNDFNKAEMKRSRNYVTKLKNDLKKDYFHKAIRDSKGDSKRLWRTINEAFGKSTSKSTVITELKGEMDTTKMADIMNSYFSTIANTLAENFPSDPPTRTEDVKHQPKFNFTHITLSDVEKQIGLLSDATAIGVDGISPRILRAALKPLSIIISKLINRSMDSGVFPDGLKVARVSPIFKSGDRTDPGNYRPISVLPSISKIYERVVHTQLVNYIDKYSLLSNSQFGFRKNHSTETCCLSMLDKMYEKLDQGCLSGVVFLDLEKAFDTVNHHVLLRKLILLGVSDLSIRWFESYLIGCKQMTKIDNVCSSEHEIMHGVPQGSILGPL